MDDLISRQAALDAVNRAVTQEAARWSLQELPSAQPEKSTEKRTETHACDLISRQAAIDACMKYNGAGYVWACIMGDIRKLPSAQPEQHHDEWCTDCREYDKEKHCCPRFNRVIRTAMADASRWIPCSERLPEYPFGCLVTVWDTNPITMDEFENVLPYFVGWDGEQWNDGEGDQCPFEVIAWMPLPEAYKPERSEEDEAD